MSCRRAGYAAIAWLALLSPLPALGAVGYVIDQLLVGIHEERSLESPIIQVVPTGTPLEVLEATPDFVRVQTGEGVVGWIDASYVTEEKPARLLLGELRAGEAARAAELTAARAELEGLRGELTAAQAAPAPAAGGPSARVSALERENRTLRERLEKEAAESARRLEALQTDLALESERRRVQEEEAALRILASTQDAQAEIDALRAQLQRLESRPEAPRPVPVSSDELRELQRLAEDNRRLKIEITRLEAQPEPRAEADAGATRLLSWRLDEATSWQLAALGLGLLLAFLLGVQVVDYATRRRHGGFRI